MAETQDLAQVQQYISGLVERARKAQGQIELATQEQVDEMCTRVAWAGVRPDFAKPYTEFCVQETGLIPQLKKETTLVTENFWFQHEQPGYRATDYIHSGNF